MANFLVCRATASDRAEAGLGIEIGCIGIGRGEGAKRVDLVVAKAKARARGLEAGAKSTKSNIFA